MLLDIVKHIVKFVKNLFSSTKLGIFLLLVIVIVAIAGTLVEQGKPIQYYYDLYGSATAGWIIRLSIDKIFGSLWMIIPTSLLIVNLIYATLSRLPVMIKSVALPKQFHHNSKINDKFLIKDKDVAIENSSTILKSYHYKIYTLEDGSLFAHKGVVSRFGAVVVHLSILIVLFGALLGAIYGYKNYIAIDSGDTEPVPEINASIKVDRFWMNYWPDGSIKQYNSKLSIIKNDKVVHTQTIDVNHPMDYAGMRFFQAGYGKSYDKIKEAVVVLYDRQKKNVIGEPIVVQWNKWRTIGPYDIKIVDFVPDFYFDAKKGYVTSKSLEYNNPAVRLQVKGPKATPPFIWEFLKYPGFTLRGFTGKDAVIVSSITPIYYTGLQYAKNPGANWIWFGSIIMVIGFIMSFFMYYRRIYITFDDDEKSLLVAGVSYKQKDLFAKEFKKICNALKKVEEK
ncbi:MAG: cytochrome c biogenesis protein [bacterium]|nr:MAG: cytochrome c biogenesis protein [bacterium]